jgi:membrane-bound metal-dependent hydrolase YbcI (DUF457 family)
MANFSTHKLTAAGVALGAYILWKKREQKPISLSGLAVSALAGAAAGSLPDALEPADNPDHRSYFHSICGGILLEKLARNRLRNPAVCSDEKLGWIVFASGYGSHLILDALTEKGLPILTD